MIKAQNSIYSTFYYEEIGIYHTRDYDGWNTVYYCFDSPYFQLWLLALPKFAIFYLYLKKVWIIEIPSFAHVRILILPALLELASDIILLFSVAMIHNFYIVTVFAIQYTFYLCLIALKKKDCTILRNQKWAMICNVLGTGCSIPVYILYHYYCKIELFPIWYVTPIIAAMFMALSNLFMEKSVK